MNLKNTFVLTFVLTVDVCISFLFTMTEHPAEQKLGRGRVLFSLTIQRNTVVVVGKAWWEEQFGVWCQAASR